MGYMTNWWALIMDQSGPSKPHFTLGMQFTINLLWCQITAVFCQMHPQFPLNTLNIFIMYWFPVSGPFLCSKSPKPHHIQSIDLWPPDFKSTGNLMLFNVFEHSDNPIKMFSSVKDSCVTIDIYVGICKLNLGVTARWLYYFQLVFLFIRIENWSVRSHFKHFLLMW